MKHYLIAIMLLMIGSSCKKRNTKETIEEPVTLVSEIPDRLFTGSEFYGVWKINYLRILYGGGTGSVYNGEGEVYLAFTNEGKVIIENKSNTPIVGESLEPGKFDDHPWYFTTGQNTFKIKSFEASNDISTAEGLPFTGKFSMTSKDHDWVSHFSDKKMKLYQWQSGNATVVIEATKVR